MRTIANASRAGSQEYQDNMLRFLKPNIWKLIVTAAFFFAVSYLWRMLILLTISDTFPWGFPFQFYTAWGPCPPGETCFEFNNMYLLLDVILWYVVSAFLVDRLQKQA
jgi:hypothetical protein